NPTSGQSSAGGVGGANAHRVAINIPIESGPRARLHVKGGSFVGEDALRVDGGDTIINGPMFVYGRLAGGTNDGFLRTRELQVVHNDSSLSGGVYSYSPSVIKFGGIRPNSSYETHGNPDDHNILLFVSGSNGNNEATVAITPNSTNPNITNFTLSPTSSFVNLHVRGRVRASG